MRVCKPVETGVILAAVVGVGQQYYMIGIVLDWTLIRLNGLFSYGGLYIRNRFIVIFLQFLFVLNYRCYGHIALAVRRCHSNHKKIKNQGKS